MKPRLPVHVVILSRLLVGLACFTSFGCSGSSSSGGTAPPPVPVGAAALPGSWQATVFTINGLDAIALGSIISLTLEIPSAVGNNTWLISVANDVVGLCDLPVGCAASGELQIDSNSQFVFDPGTPDQIVWTYVAEGTELRIVGTDTDGTSIMAAFDLTITPQPPSPALLTYEGFDYEANAGLVDNNGGTGWAAPWQPIGANGEIVDGLQPTGISSDLLTLGRATRTQAPGRDGRRLDLSPLGPFAQSGYLDANGDIGADGTTLYISFLQQSTTPDFFWEFEFKRDDILTDGGRIAGIGNNVAGGTDVNLRAPSNQFTSLGPADTNVNLWVMRIDYQPGLDNVYVYRNPSLVVEPSQADVALISQANMAFDAFTLGAFVSGGRVSHDEIRIGPSYASVTPR